ncbi:MAG: hypothetical protein H0U74_05620 [Bradymonadaceae bacterium]|nr:hypothetical protein [Lujinxingiaceae bacterium]
MILWIGVLVAVVASLAIATVRLAGLSELPVFLGPDLTVRTVRMDRGAGPEVQQFQRGDRLVAVQRQAVDDLRDLRLVLPNFPAQTEQVIEEAFEDDGNLLVDYQIVRPLHRFTLALQGDPLDPLTLPPGVEPKDRLVEIDGRQLPGVGPEGLRSIMASRPDALLGFERPNAVFVGQMRVPKPMIHYGIVLTFGLALLIILILWRFRSETLHPLTTLAIALETLGIAWLFLLAFQYQWLIADYTLTACLIVGLVMMRPLAIYARDQSVNDDATRGKVALGLGVLVALSLVVLLYYQLPNAETALHMAAILTGLFIIYEIVITGYEQGSRAMLGERGGYLVGIVILVLFAGLVAALMEPLAFEEDRWRWFVVLIPTLVWFGDVLFCLRQSGGHGWADIGDKQARQITLLEYFRLLGRELPQTSLQFVLHRNERSIVLADRGSEVEVLPASGALNDAVAILIQENARIPLAESAERQVHPMAGIAQTMQMALALRLSAPSHGIQVDQAYLVLIALQHLRAGEMPTYASAETLDHAQKHMTSQIWSAAMIEGLEGFASMIGQVSGTTRVGADPETPVKLIELQVRIEEASAQLVESEESLRLMNRECAELATRVQFFEHQWSQTRLGLSDCQRLLEVELIEGVQYLLASDDAIVVAGANGVGREFVAWCAHLLEGRPQALFGIYDASRGSDKKDVRVLLGAGPGVGRQPSGLLEQCQGGTVFVRSSENLSDTLLVDLCNAAREFEVRLFLAFTSHDAEKHSVLEGRPGELRARLGERELILPSFFRRRTIMRPVLLHFLAEAAQTRGKVIDGFSSMAMQALEAYDYPGEINEARMIVDLAVARAAHDVIDLEDLSLEVRPS